MNPKLLVVDDERGIVDMIQSYFQTQYDILTAYSGQEALKKVACKPDLILLDINMPGMDGLTVCQKIREHIACPILFLTARIESSDKIIGYEGVDKRIDVLATAIHAGLKATQLKDLDLAYAPPYSSAKDPVNMAGFMIDNIAKGTLKQWHLEDMDKISKDKSAVLLDVRTVGEFNRGHINGFKNIPVDELRERINEVEKEKPVYLICQSGLRSYIASRILEGNGYETYNFSGGFRFYDTVVNDRALIEMAYACGMDY